MQTSVFPDWEVPHETRGKTNYERGARSTLRPDPATSEAGSARARCAPHCTRCKNNRELEREMLWFNVRRVCSAPDRATGYWATIFVCQGAPRNMYRYTYCISRRSAGLRSTFYVLRSPSSIVHSSETTSPLYLTVQKSRFEDPNIPDPTSSLLLARVGSRGSLDYSNEQVGCHSNWRRLQIDSLSLRCKGTS